MSWLNLQSLVGCLALPLLAWLLGGLRRPFPRRTVLGAGAACLALGGIIFWAPPARRALLWLNDFVIEALARATAGTRFLLGPLALGPGEEGSVGFILAAQVLPAVIFFASLTALLYHLRLLQPLVRGFARIFRRSMSLSGAESLAGASSLFFGVESVTAIRPYLQRMTRSELLTILTCGMSTVASTTLAIYVAFLSESFPTIAGHLISASLLSVPAAVIMSKLILPETEVPATLGALPPLEEADREENAIAAVAQGAWSGLRLALGIGTLLIAVLGLVAWFDWALAALIALVAGSSEAAEPAGLATLLGFLFRPLAWLLGIPAADVAQASTILGQRVILTEVVAYQQLGRLSADQLLDPRTTVVLSYALCGFAHVASMSIFVGGLSALAPGRRAEVTSLGPRALLAATLATLLTGALAGLFYAGQPGVLGA